MFTVTKALEEALLQHFKYVKLDIAYAINKPFPFFEALRDNSFITENMYKESQEAFQNMVPLSKVVHKVLTNLEKTFHMSLLQTLFSHVNLREYPNMEAIFRSFKSVAAAYEGRNRTTQTLVEVPSDPAEGCSLQALPPLPPPQPPPPSHLSSATRACEVRASSCQITEILDGKHNQSHPAVPPTGFTQEETTTPAASNGLTTTTDKEENLERMPSPSPGTMQVSSKDHQRKDKEDSEETTPSPSGPVSVIKDNLTSKTNEEDNSGASPPGSPGTVDVVKDGSPAANDLEMPQEAPSTPANKKAKKKKRCIWSTPKRRQQKKKPPQGVTSPGVQKKVKVLVQKTLRKNDPTRNLKEVTSTGKTRSQCAQTPRSQEFSDEASKTKGRRRPQKTHSLPPRTRHKQSKDDAVDFLSPVLPVTCGKAKGILFKEKLKQGFAEKCIQNEAGAWFTPKEFLIEGERTKSKDWKRAIRCKAKTLRFLEEKRLLLQE